MTQSRMITKNNFNYFEAMSAMQKAIRRCQEDEAVFFAIELYESGYIQHLWNRFFIIAHEDIGLAEDISSKLIGLKQSYDYLEKHRPKAISKRLVFLQTIITLARAKKSRYIDYAYMVYWAQHDELAKSQTIPDYAFDMHTYKGKKQGKGINHFYKESAKINNEGDVPGEERFKRLAKEVDERLEKQPKEKPQSPQNKLFE